MYHNNGMLFFIGAFYLTIIFALIAVMIIGLWKIFTKAGEKGWKSLIPIYNGYILITKVARKSPAYFWGPIIGYIALASMFVALIGTTSRYGRIGNITGLIMGLISAAFYIGIFVLAILINLAIAKNFGKSTGFAVGLILLPMIFYLILGFGDDKFIYLSKEDKTSSIEDDEYEYEYIYVDEEDDDKL